MTEKQLSALFLYIDCRIAEKVNDRLGNECIEDTVATGRATQELRIELGIITERSKFLD